MHRDLIELLCVLNAHGVRYLVVGGYAVSFHAQPRATKDIDVLIQADAENGILVYRALSAFGAPLKGLTPADFSQRGSFFRLGHDPVAVDILTEIPGVDFETAWERRIEGTIERDTPVNVHFISREDLIAAKTAAGRPQDLADVAAIQKAAKAKKSGK